MNRIKAFLLLASPIWLGCLFAKMVTNDPNAIEVISVLSALILAFALDKHIQYRRKLEEIRDGIKNTDE